MHSMVRVELFISSTFAMLVDNFARMTNPQ